MAETYGTCDPTFNAVRELLAQQVANGSEVGVSICVNINRKDVLDIWSGHADPERTKPWDKDTLTPPWSCSKVVNNLAGPPSSAVITATPGFRGAEIGAANGLCNARSLVRIGSMVSLNGTVDGKQYFSPGVIDRLCEEQISEIDMTVPCIPEGRICFWSGWGGAFIIMDLDRRMTISYVMNKMTQAISGNKRTELYIREIYKIVDSL